MSKKKAFSGSTMTLKDFHGGSIPSDLPLPSAPGGVVVVRPAAAVFDRQIPNAWGGNPISNRSDHRSRPGSSGTNRTNYDQKPSFFSNPSHIHIGARNFDEDERKPLDGLSIPRRTVSDESISVLPARYEPKQPESLSRRSITSPVTANQPRFSGSQTNATGSSLPNAWGTRKEVATVAEPLHSSNWSGPNAVSRFAQASALEKVSSGRWQSKHVVTQQPDIEVIRYQDDTDFPNNRVYNSFNGISDKGDYDVTRGRYAEKNSFIEDETTGGGKGSPMYYYEGKERSSTFTHDVVRPATVESKLSGSQMSTQMTAEAMERPKIKLLPRSKPVEALETPIVDYRQGYQIPFNTAHVEAVSESYANEISTKPGSSGSEGGKRAVERPRLNLKPRSQPLEQSDSITERERKSLFGGARPRELVLKERGVDDVVINNLDVIQSPNRVKQEHPKTEVKPEPMISTPVYGGDRHENLQHDHKSPRNFERKADSSGDQRGSWRNENWRNNREQERRHEPDTWRKPVVEQPNSPPSDSGVRYGKAASALELAQAFSRSNSGVSGQKSVPVPGRNQIPFSRLTADTREFYSGPTSRRQINGY
ncbi:hypothetical protein ACHQM5_025703 [Ranunculus cassubicifolius]